MESVHNGEEQLKLVERATPIGPPSKAPDLQCSLDVEQKCKDNLQSHVNNL